MSDESFDFQAFISSLGSANWLVADEEAGIEICLVEHGPQGPAVCFRVAGKQPKVFGAQVVLRLCDGLYQDAQEFKRASHSAKVN